MTIQKLEELLAQSESEKLDFKQDLLLEKESAKKEFVKDVTAIANSKGGRGYILFGIQDKTKKILGISEGVCKEEKIHQIISTRCDPPVAVRFDEILYQGKKIAALTIFKSEQAPHQILQTGTFYIRRGSTTDVARRYEIAGMLQENGLLCYETTLLSNASLEDMDIKTLKKQFGRNLNLSQSSTLYLLESMGFIGRDIEKSDYHPTAGGLLLLGSMPQKFLPATGIQFQRKNEITRLEGNIPALLQQAEKKIAAILEDINYPVQAIYEALYNAIVHRDYWDRTREITIIIEDKRVEITNPGAIWRREGILRTDYDMNPPRRNIWLYQRLLLLDKKQRFIKNPLGIRTIRESFPENSGVKFINLPKRNIFKVVLPGIKEIPC